MNIQLKQGKKNVRIEVPELNQEQIFQLADLISEQQAIEVYYASFDKHYLLASYEKGFNIEDFKPILSNLYKKVTDEQ